MKKIILLLLIFRSSANFSNAQTQNWEWAKSVGGTAFERGLATAIDAQGNVYVTGFFTSNFINVGNSCFLSDTGTDIHDFFTIKYDSLGNAKWAKSSRGNNNAFGYGIAVDSKGNVWVTGSFSGYSITFDSTIVPNNGTGDANVYIVEYDSTGKLLSAKQIGGRGIGTGYGIVTDSLDNVYVTGNITGDSLIFGNDTILQNTTLFVVKYNSSGNVLWVNGSVGIGAANPSGIAVSPNGNVYITGNFLGSVNFGNGVTISDTGLYGRDIFVTKYNSSGEAVWAKSSVVSGQQVGTGVASDAGDNVIITGYFATPSIIFDTFNLKSNGSTDFYLVKYDSTGNVLWAKTAGTTGAEANGIATDATGNIYQIGNFGGDSIIIEGTKLVNYDTLGGTPDIFLVKYDAGGNVIWAKHAGGIFIDNGNAVATAGGNVCITGYSTGYFSGSLMFGNISVPTASSDWEDDIIIAKIGAPLITDIPFELSNSFAYLFPNPANNSVHFYSSAKIIHYEIVDIYGRLITIRNSINNNEGNIDISAFPAGIYFLQMKTENGSVIRKFVKE